MANETHPFVSVIIPVYNDVKRLCLCLGQLEKQTYPSDRYEVIVVDNGSSEDIKHLEKEYGHVVVLREEQPGSYAARNKGISCARGDYFGFTDSDCIPQLNWIEQGMAVLVSGDQNIGLVGGKIGFFFKDPDNPTAVELLDSILNLQQDRYINHVKYAATANLFTRRDVFDKVGLFDNRVKSGGDRDWGQRVAAAGYKLVYAEDACILHPARHSMSELHKKVVRVIGGHHQLKSQGILPLFSLDFIKTLFRDLVPPVRFMVRLSKDDRVKGFNNKIKVLMVFMLDRYIRAWTRIRLQLGWKPTR